MYKILGCRSVSAVVVCAFAALGTAYCEEAQAPALPPLPILSPTALTADPGDGRAYLRWNLQLEDERVVGWKVLQLRPEERNVTDKALTEPQHVVRGLNNGTTYTFAVVGVLKDGKTTPHSNEVTVTPRDVGTATVVKLKAWQLDRGTDKWREGASLSFGKFKEVRLVDNPVKVVFPDGQELIYDRYRPVDWKARDGRHLIYPEHFGNGLDIGKFEPSGLPRIIPPEGEAPLFDERPYLPRPKDSEYSHAQSGTRHPFITDPMSLPLSKSHHDARPRWFEPAVDGNRVTFHWWQPLTVWGYKAWIYVLVWETWWPIESDRHGTTRHGLARLVEVEMPGALKHGYQVMLNNGFGPDGSRKGVISYNTGFRRPGAEVVDFSPDENRQVYFQSVKPPRQGYGYHMNQDCLQSSPLIFYDWGTGSLTTTARSLYWHCASTSSSYIEQGADGVWPNLAWDMAIAGKRTAVDTVEYLYTSDMGRPLPQRYLDARFEAYGNVSRRMGVQDELRGVSMTAGSGAKGDGGPAKHAKKVIDRIGKYRSVDAYAIYFEFWNASPLIVGDAYRLDPTHGINPELKQMCDLLSEAGIHVGFWLRPELARSSIVNALCDRIPTAAAYYCHAGTKYPDVVELMKERGIPLLRENPQWIRSQRDGSWPRNTPYQWIPMSMAGGWWDRVLWPTLKTSSELGFDFLELDGGFAGLQGVDYAPMLAGRADGAVACMPYMWRFFRTMHHVDIRLFGECTVGWKGGTLNITGDADEHRIWMFSLGVFSMGWSNKPRAIIDSPERLHKLFQLYNGLRQDVGDHAVRRFARKFFAEHRAPDWVELKDLRREETVTVSITWAESPVGGKPGKVDENNPVTGTIEPWTWSDVVWRYYDGTSVVYPAYEKIDSGSE